MKVVIHRGSHEIGGTCISITTPKTKLLLDAGMPLSDASVGIDINSIKPDAVFISHPHTDHFGMMETVDPSIPVYMGQLSKKLIDSTRMFIRKRPLINKTVIFKPGETIVVNNDIHVTPHLVDHSSAESFAFEIEADGKRLFYSGDFRGHGNKGQLFEQMLKNPPKNIDVMFMEGTCIQRSNDIFPTEHSVFKVILEVLEGQANISFLISSAQNIDRLVWAHHACQDAGKIMVIDLYMAWVLEALSSVSDKTPTMASPNVKVFIDFNFYSALNNNRLAYNDFIHRAFQKRVKEEQLRANPAGYLYCSRISGCRRMKAFAKHGKINIIYSQWRGYLEKKEDRKVQEFNALAEKNNYVYAHTSGHAPLSDLKKLAQAINPQMLVPIHTEHASEFKKHFSNVYEATDNFGFEV